MFPSLLKQRNWFKFKRDVKVGDVVLRKGKTEAGQTYKYARLLKVHEGLNGKVRSADVEYQVPGESKFRGSTRPIHKLVLMSPVQEQTTETSGKRQKGSEEMQQLIAIRGKCIPVTDGSTEERGGFYCPPGGMTFPQVSFAEGQQIILQGNTETERASVEVKKNFSPPLGKGREDPLKDKSTPPPPLWTGTEKVLRW